MIPAIQYLERLFMSYIYTFVVTSCIGRGQEPIKYLLAEHYRLRISTHLTLHLHPTSYLRRENPCRPSKHPTLSSQ